MSPSEAQRLQFVIFRLLGALQVIDSSEEFFETHERELADEILKTVIARIEAIKGRTQL